MEKGRGRDASLRLYKSNVVISLKKCQTGIYLFDLAEAECDVPVKRTQSGLMRARADGGFFCGFQASIVQHLQSVHHTNSSGQCA